MTEYNKVVYDGQTLIDLTQDDVTASDVRSGVYFHDSAGVRGQGTLTSTSIPTADTIAEWDSSAHMNSTDMTAQEISDFVDSLNVTPFSYSGYGVSTNIESYTSKVGAYTIPSNGLIRIQCRYTATNYIGVTVCNADGTNEFSIQIGGNGGANINTAFPVFKGMKAWRSSNNGDYNVIQFIPYI